MSENLPARLHAESTSTSEIPASLRIFISPADGQFLPAALRLRSRRTELRIPSPRPYAVDRKVIAYDPTAVHLATGDAVKELQAQRMAHGLCCHRGRLARIIRVGSDYQIQYSNAANLEGDSRQAVCPGLFTVRRCPAW